MREFYYQYKNGDEMSSGVVSAANEDAAYSVIRDTLQNQRLDVNSDYWEFTRVDNLLDVFERT